MTNVMGGSWWRVVDDAAGGINPDDFSFDPMTQFLISSRDIHPKPFRGYTVPYHESWSFLRGGHYKSLSKLKNVGFPTEAATVLSLCGGSGFQLSEMATVFKSSRLVLLDACAKNIADAMRRLPLPRDGLGNTYEFKLTDARDGFGGIPYPNNTFDLIGFVRKSEFGMSIDDQLRLFKEIFRVLKYPTGRFLIQTDVLDRYPEVVQLFVNEERMTKPIAMYPLNEQAVIITFHLPTETAADANRTSQATESSI